MNGLQYLESLAPSSIKMGLDRVRAALARLGNPERAVPALHVAGTNGKGSTCAFAAACLSRRYRTGLYTSPHLERVNERIAISGSPIDDATLAARVDEVRRRLGDAELTYFEFLTVVAFVHFAAERVDLAVLETGLGGRLDATTACVPLVTAVTPVDFDHQAYLGHTLASIAGEKAGIAKPGVPLVLSTQAPEAMAVFEALGGVQVREGRDFAGQGGATFSYRGGRYAIEGVPLSLRGPHQVQNAAVAVACLEQLADRAFALNVDEVRAGLASAVWPGRFEVFDGSPPVVLDGAHNPAGVEVLAQALDATYPGRPIELVFGAFADKDVAAMARRLFPKARAVYLAPLASPRAMGVEQLEALARSLSSRVSVANSPAQALALARAQAPSNGLVVVAGSLMLVGALRSVLAPR